MIAWAFLINIGIEFIKYGYHRMFIKELNKHD